MSDLTQAETHFEFGANWKDYLQHIDDAAIARAESGLLKLLPKEEIRGARLLDLGCGSGLHSLSALRLGVAELVATDIDADSVEATRATLQRFAPGANATIRQLSVFEATPEQLGTFDIVYSWGVLHHTGAMWRAIEQAARLVKPGGLFAIALYQKTPLCGAWTIEKRIYTNSPKLIRKVIRGTFKAALYAAITITRGNPREFIRNYAARGMNFQIDVEDWLGGYPYESASPEQILGKFRELGFEPARAFPLRKKLGLGGTGCAEFTFRKQGA